MEAEKKPKIERLDQMKVENDRYMRDHPELGQAINQFLIDVMINKPDNVREYAKQYFMSQSLQPK